MKQTRISGFQWAMMVFIFFIITEVLHMILGDFQRAIHVKRYLFDIRSIAPLVAAIICIIIFKHRQIQLQSMKFTLSFKVIERMILALILPALIFILCMVSFNVFADSFILLQADDLSVSVISVLIGQLIMAFIIELGFRSYLQNALETKLNTFFASIVVGIIYAIVNVHLEFSFTYTLYSMLYAFTFSMLIGELIRATKGRTIYIATLFHAAMSFGLVFLFNEELGNVFAMKVIALATTVVAAGYIILTLIIRGVTYLFTRKSLDEVEANNYMDHLNDNSDLETADDSKKASAKNKKSQSTTSKKDKTISDDDRAKAATAGAVTTKASKGQNNKDASAQEQPKEKETQPQEEAAKAETTKSDEATSSSDSDALERAQASVEHSEDTIQRPTDKDRTELDKTESTTDTHGERTSFNLKNEHDHRR
ncbi:type II CAAX prenyl endopeptidase Rce1 family protein [Staphylococcus argensis]|uniref:Lysostaphin resistance protein A n=1 Tax=Staphylococcus argensis TaxID=1607738 RepID=A0A2K4FC25_9STAP|nr:CPBP family glutamic-type intramembrane protease [Staphylococcus argensis]MCY6992009.1 CPBP family glutamic-type intramembrane protease [Staphylococcus argensis]POA08851.1 lysostaphin resistance protein A [Staphylococcus argensis]